MLLSYIHTNIVQMSMVTQKMSRLDYRERYEQKIDVPFDFSDT